MRTFAAILLPEDVRDALCALSTRLRKEGLQAGWVKPDNLHLPLRFYGELDEAQASRLLVLLSERLAGREAPVLLARGVGAFPTLRRPSILWAGLETGTDALEALQEDTEQSARDIGLRPETRRFHPHVTLARLRAPGRARGPQSLLSRFQEEGRIPEFGQEFVARSVVLFKSSLTPRGPVYTVLREIPLK